MQRISTKWLVILPVVTLFSTVSAQAPKSHGNTATATDEASQAEMSEWWSSGRYRLTPTDVFEVFFPYVPEFNQTVVVQPDGYVSLRPIGELRVEGRTLPELKQMLLEEYEPILRDPVISIALREFEKPYFVASGQVKAPGKFDLRGKTTVTQALALAGGATTSGNQSQVVLFRRYANDLLEVKIVNVSKMLDAKNLSEDPLLRPGDTLYVPKSLLSQIEPFIPKASIGFYLNPFE